jgi:hypothetical protein
MASVEPHDPPNTCQRVNAEQQTQLLHVRHQIPGGVLLEAGMRAWSVPPRAGRR